MSHYLIQISYEPASWDAQMNSPEDARDRVNSTAEAVGGRLESLFYAFGEHDLIGVLEFPNDKALAAWSIAISAGGAARSVQSTSLLTIEDGMAAMRDASRVSKVYRPVMPLRPVTPLTYA